MLVLLGILIAGILISVAFMARSRNPGWQILPALGWTGGLLVIGSFLFLPWVTLGPPGTVERNAEWIANKAEVVDIIKQMPGFEDWLASVHAPTGNDIIVVLDHPVQDSFLQYASTGKMINGYYFMGLIRRVKPLVVLAMAGGILSALAGAVLNLRRLVTSRYDFQGVFQAIASMAVLSSLFLLSSVTTFDTLGTVDDFKLRLLTTLAETRLSAGAWWVLSGLALVGVSGIADLVRTIAPWQNSSSESDYLSDEDY